ncbi:MAG: DNA repair protein RecN [Gammaproteobacteria bacterium TMED78]|nr:MAG: DNA repair protein RecN [Gammaproteobacteria bacterium TMED78]
MLSLIRVKNYAIIDYVEIEISSGLIVMTGETGAGKSILVDAIGLALGDRAKKNIVKKGADRAEISLIFDLPDNHPASKWLKANCLDEDRTCLIRRIINKDGKSRAFINSNSVTLKDLKKIGGLLIEIHGQHSHQSLLYESSQREILDFISKSSKELEGVKESYKKLKNLKKQINDLHEIDNNAGQLDFIKFQYQELNDLNLEENELEELESRQKKLANIDKISGSLNDSLNYLSGEGSNVALNIINATKELNSISNVSPEISNPISLLESAEIQIDEAIKSIHDVHQKLESEPFELDKVENRLSKIRELSRKHRVSDNELIHLSSELNKKINILEISGESLKKLNKKIISAESDFIYSAKKLSKKRIEAIPSLESAIEKQLTDLGMPNAKFKINIEKKDISQASSTGLDKIIFSIKTNPGQDFGLLSKIASGGELSRISLALEVIRLGSSAVTTMIFDEVDNGIGGKIAEIVGRRLNQIAINRQVLCVTHLAQVASQGSQQYKIDKISHNNLTRTEISLLNKEQRIDEVSRMIGGVDITEKTRAHAKEMISQANIN